MKSKQTVTFSINIPGLT